MPHSREVRPTSHDAHDPILMAALAADDLAGTDRDQALDLTRSCVDCALLHDDLRALARATASAPPPITERSRDFQLTPADAARLRPNGWRRLVAALSGARAGLSRPLGVGLATIGLAGLLIGNVQLTVGGSTVSPAAAPMSGQAAGAAAPSDGDSTNFSGGVQTTNGGAEGAAPASAAAPAASAAASGAPPAPGDSSTRNSVQDASASGEPRAVAIEGAPAASGGKATGAGQGAPESELLTSSAADEPFRPLNVLFGAAIVLGFGLLLLSTRRGRSIT